jgi:hypothetical protein
MKSRWMTAQVSGLCLLSLGLLASCQSTEKIKSKGRAALRPLNGVVVTIDTLRPDHVHC